MFALISPNEPSGDGKRIAQVSAEKFEVSPPLFWIECDCAVAPETHCYDGSAVIALPPYVAPVPAPEEQRRALEAAVQRHLDAQAQAHGYDSILSACSYAGSPNQFQAEGAAYLTWRAACWQHGYTVLAEVQAGTRPVPTADALVAELPALVLP